MPLQYLFTGYPYSGTGYTAKLLTAHGLAAGHESVLPAGTDWRQGGGGGGHLVVEVNGHAALHGKIESARMFKNLQVVHLVRHPVKALTSIRGVNAAGADMSRSVAMWIAAQEYVEELAVARCRVERPEEILAAVGKKLKGKPRFGDTTYNTHKNAPNRRELSWADMPGPDTEVGARLRELAKRYGYSVHGLNLEEPEE